MSGFDPDKVASLAGIIAIVAFIAFLLIKGKFIPESTHKRELTAAEAHASQAHKDRDEQVAALRSDMSTRMEAFRQDHGLRMQQAREDHDKQLEALVKVAESQLTNFSAVLASKDRDIDQWRSAWQITDQANREEWAGQVDELIAAARTQRRWLEEFQRATGVPELPTDRGSHE